jgi:hypothetical protein
MNDGIEASALEPLHQFAGGNHVRQLSLGQVPPFAVMAEDIGHGDIGAAGVIERRYHVRSDETGSSGYQQHEIPIRVSPATFAPVLPDRQLERPDLSPLDQDIATGSPKSLVLP